MEARANELLPLSAKIAREFDNIPRLSHAAITTLREKLETMGFNGLDTLGLLKSASCGIPEGHGRLARHLLPASP